MSNHIIRNKEFTNKFQNYIRSISSDNSINTFDVPGIMLHTMESIDSIFPHEFTIDILEDIIFFLIQEYCIYEVEEEDKIKKNINIILLLIYKNKKSNKKKCNIL